MIKIIEFNNLKKVSVVGLLLVFMFSFNGVVLAQSVKIGGTVTDAGGETLVGVIVMEKGTSRGTITDASGRFIFDVSSSESVLVISYIGYVSQEIAVGNKTNVKVQLQPDTKDLDEVVVVGYGAQKKESVVGAISQMSSDDILQSPSANLSQAISGKMPGVITTQTSGAPGADDVNIYIRGQASFAGDNQPLVMVDGVEREFSQIAPDDIESISVLKDASATAVYGVRGANGVILITTKRGKNSRPVVSLTANWQFQSPTRKPNYLDSYQSVLLLEEALSNDGLASQYSATDVEKYRQSVNGELSAPEQQLYPNVNWYDEVMAKSAPAQRYNANIQGGSDRMRYFASLEYYDQDGLMKEQANSYDYGQNSNMEFRRYGFNANLDFDLTKSTLLSVNFGTRFEERNRPTLGSRLSVDDNDAQAVESEIFLQLNRTPGWLFPVQYENGYYGGNSQNQDNVVAALAQGGFYRSNNTINRTDFIVEQKLDVLTKGLSMKGRVSFDYETYYTRRFDADYATYELIDRGNPSLAESYTKYNEDTELAYSRSSQTATQNLYMEYALNYVRTFNEVHNVTGLLLYNQNDRRHQAELQRRYQGIVGRVTYNYDDRYFAEFNAGLNGSENFQEGDRFGFFPAFSAGWMLTNEEWMKVSWLDKLKIRASYGEVGNDKFIQNGTEVRFLYIDNWSWYNNVYYLGDANYNTGVYEGAYPNYFVTWERAKKTNLAFESTLFENLDINVDYFYESRDKILTNYLSKPSYIGVDLAAGNLGETINKGYELQLNYRGKITPQLKYNVGFNFTHAKNEITQMNEPDGKPNYRRGTGHSIGQFFGLQADGFITQADLNGGDLPKSTFVEEVHVGDLKYVDQNKDGFIDDRDVTQMGYSNIPQNTYSMNLGLEYKNWSLSAMFAGASKVSRYFDAEALYAFVDGGKVREEHLERWNPGLSEEQNLARAKYPLLHYDDYGNHNQRQNSFFLKNGNFLRLKNVELSYRLPKEWISRVGMSSCRLYVNGNNLITWDKLDGLTDPEATSSNVYPITKSFNFGVNVQF
ncbi:MAG: SusC/RagA family TonB-linked outer membrane protein [Mangrovibacterium sp.]